MCPKTVLLGKIEKHNNCGKIKYCIDAASHKHLFIIDCSVRPIGRFPIYRKVDAESKEYEEVGCVTTSSTDDWFPTSQADFWHIGAHFDKISDPAHKGLILAASLMIDFFEHDAKILKMDRYNELFG